MKIVLGLLMVCCLAVGQAKRPSGKSKGAESYTLVDEIIRALLQRLKEQISDLKIPDVNEAFLSDMLNATFIGEDITIKNLEDFDIVNLHSTLIPLKIGNLTLRWKNINGSATYDFEVSAEPVSAQRPIRFFGKGKASASLNNITFTIGANLERKNDAFQIKPDGLFGFDLRLESSDVSLESLMGSTALGKSISRLISYMLPVIVEEFKHPLFNLLKDDIIKILNDALKAKKVALDDESFEESETF